MALNTDEIYTNAQETDVSSGFDIFLEQGYAQADLKAIDSVLRRNRIIVVSEASKNDPYGDVDIEPNREDYFLAALRLYLQRSCEEVLSYRRRSTSEPRMLDAYKIILTTHQTPEFVASFEEFYRVAYEAQQDYFWVILEEYANRILGIFRRAQSARNKGILLYCLSMLFSKRALVMHDASVKSISGNGGLECDVLLRELKSFKKQNSYVVRASKKRR